MPNNFSPLISINLQVTASSGIAVVTFAFTGFMPKHRCAISQCDENGTSENANYDFPKNVFLSKELKEVFYKPCERIKFEMDEIFSCQDYLTAINRGEQIVYSSKL